MASLTLISKKSHHIYLLADTSPSCLKRLLKLMTTYICFFVVKSYKNLQKLRPSNISLPLHFMLKTANGVSITDPWNKCRDWIVHTKPEPNQENSTEN